MFKLLSMFDFLQSVCPTLVLALDLCIPLFLVPGEGGVGGASVTSVQSKSLKSNLY